MSPALSAFLVAGTVTLLLTPLFRRIARGIRLYDVPGPAKVHSVPVPYLGGLAIAAGVLTAIALTPADGLRVGVVAVMAAALCAVGLVDDAWHLPPRTRLVIEALVALVTLAVGIRFEVTGSPAVDGALTVLWIVGLINAINFLDNMDGLGAGVAGSIAISSMVLALGVAGGPGAALAAAVVGACLGFLAYNKPPASVYMGDAGSLFLGYLVSVIALSVTQPLLSDARGVVLLLLAAIPLADTTTVVILRLRHGISPVQAGKDHLSHRLVAVGLSRESAVAALVSSSLTVGVLGALAGRQILPMSAAVIGAVLVLGLVLPAAIAAPVYRTPAPEPR
jgi:UDP-GlcNAc:undecaprenyl-phosphate GlcNAc-1-phosphate transferase